MASIIDSVDETITDNNSILKIIIFSIPIFLLAYKGANLPAYKFWSVLISIFTFGIMLSCTYNVRVGNNYVLPSFNIFMIFWRGLKGIVALIPMAIVSQLLGVLFVGFLKNAPLTPLLLSIFSIIIFALCYSFTYTAYLLYSHKFKILDAYNIKLIVKYCVDVLIAILFMSIQLFILDLLVILPVGYVIWLFWGFPNPAILFYLCMVTIFNSAIIGHYLAQIDYEIIEVSENQDKFI